jgi:lytic murein transglycosylase
MMLRLCLIFAIAGVSMPAIALAQQCGGDFGQFKQGVKSEAIAAGISARAADAALSGAQIDRKVLSRDRAQGVFKQTFLTFSKRSVSSYRLKNGASNMKKYASVFARAEQEYGVPASVVTAFWALETDFGAVLGDFNTINALATLAHDCRRPQLFRPQLIAAISMVEHGDLDPARTTGAWAGEIGQVQMLPADIVRLGIDADGNGHVDVKISAPDALLTSANFIRELGWRRGEPWMQEVLVPESFPWQEAGFQTSKTGGEWARLGVRLREGSQPDTGLSASLILPQGRKGPAFLVYPNFSIYLEWNQSLVYTMTAAYLAARLAGAPRYNAGSPDEGLSDDQMKLLQQKLQARGHDVGEIDGILGSGTRTAVRAEQIRLGLPADSWPTSDLLHSL